VTWSWVPGAPLEGCGISDTTCRFEASGVGYQQVGVYQRGACGAIRCFEAAAWKVLYIAGTGTISGRITNTDGEPVSGIVLTVVGEETDEQVTTDESGDYQIDVPQGDYTVTPRDYADAYEPGAPQFQQFEPSEESVTLEDEATADFELRGWELAGTITEDREDMPVAGVRVKVWRGERSFTATTDESGRYEITLPEGSYTVQPRTPIPNDDAAIAGGAFKPDRLAVSLSADVDDADFEVDTTLDLSLEIEGAGSNRHLVKVTVRNAEGDPVPDQQVELIGWTFPPWALVCRTDGRRVWPTVLPHLGDGFIPTANEDNPITAITDGDGVAELYLLAGTQAGEYSMEARIPDSDREDETDVASVTLSAGPSGLPSASALADELAIFFRTTQTRAGSPTQGSAVGQTSFLLAMAEHNFNLAPYAPIYAADGSGAGIMFYRSTDADTVDAILDVLLGSPASAQGSIQAYVLDADPMQLVGQGNPVPPELPTLRDWVEGYSGQLRPRLSDLNNPDATPPAGFAAPAHGAARPGRQGAGEEETQLTFWGWPAPPSPSSGEAWALFSRCTGASWAASAGSVYSPVNLLYVDADGNRLGYDAAGEFFGEIPGGFVAGEPGDEPVTYILPVGDYTVQVFGTGSGPATVRFETPTEDGPGFVAFTFDAEAGVDGSVALTGNVPAPVLSYGGVFVPSTAGLMLSVDGAPSALPVDTWTEVTIEVSTNTGQPAAGATVRATTPDGAVDATTVADADGNATFSIRPVTLGLPITLEVGGPGYEPALTTIEASSASPPAPPGAATEANPTAAATAASEATAADGAATEAEPSDDDGGGSSNTFLIVIAAAVALAAGGGYFVWRRRSEGGAP
jgi:LPXTG-motif cell wall-anchored protein